MEFKERNEYCQRLNVTDVKQNINGVFASAVDFIQSEQLLDEQLWIKFVNQFREQPDASTLAWRGEYWGKMMRGAVSVYFYSKSEKLYSVLEQTVKDMLTVAEEDGRVSTYEREKEFQGWDIWCRKYVLLGMLYFYDICHSDALKTQIIDFSVRHTDYIIDHIGEGKLDITKASSSWFGINSSSLLEPVVWLYLRTGENRYLDFAEYIVNRGGADRINVFELAYENKLLPYQYGVSKAYELTSCFEGLIVYYGVTGIEKYKTAAVNYGYAVLNSEVSIIGSLGCTHELLDHTLISQTAHRGTLEQETCVTVTWMKYCASLYRLTADPKFAEAIENSFYNAYLGAINTEHRESSVASSEKKSSFMPFDSYSPLTPGTRGMAVGGRQTLSDGSYYGCCACIGSVGLGIYAAHRLLVSEREIVLSFFDDGQSRINWHGTEVKVTVCGNYPKSSDVRITVEAQERADFDFRIRIPSWSKNAKIKSDRSFRWEEGFIVFCGEWKGKSDISLSFDMSIRALTPISWDEDVVYTDMTGSAGGWHFANAETVKHRPEFDDYISLFRGPITLCADTRLGKSADSVFTFKKKDDGSFDCAMTESDSSLLSLRFEGIDSTSFTLIDYASAGKDWQSVIAAWLPTN